MRKFSNKMKGNMIDFIQGLISRKSRQITRVGWLMAPIKDNKRFNLNTFL
jgi:hypothetical protein